MRVTALPVGGRTCGTERPRSSPHPRRRRPVRAGQWLPAEWRSSACRSLTEGDKQSRPHAAAGVRPQPRSTRPGGGAAPGRCRRLERSGIVIGGTMPTNGIGFRMPGSRWLPSSTSAPSQSCRPARRGAWRRRSSTSGSSTATGSCWPWRTGARTTTASCSRGAVRSGGLHDRMPAARLGVRPALWSPDDPSRVRSRRDLSRPRRGRRHQARIGVGTTWPRPRRS